jgi:hypothetical protein
MAGLLSQENRSGERTKGNAEHARQQEPVSSGLARKPCVRHDDVGHQEGERIMKVISYRHNGAPGVGVMVGDTGFVTLSAVAPDLPDSLRAILEIDPDLERVRAAVAGKSVTMSIDDITFDPVIPAPHATWALALNYTLHIEETGLTTSREFPQIFQRMPICQVGHREALWAPRLDMAEAYDY